MHFTSAAAAVSLLAVSAQAWKPSSTNGTDRLATIGKAKLERHHAALGSNPSCNSNNTAVRKEWLSLSDGEKIAYTDAVKCLMELPSISGDAIPGAKSRFDDFVGVHINQTPFIHVTVSNSSIPSHHCNILTQDRATSSHGTATSPGPTSTPSAQSVATKVTSLTSTGASTPTISSARHFSTAAQPP
jgi:hypothetical protein